MVAKIFVLEDDRDTLQYIEERIKEAGILEYYLYSSSDGFVEKLKECKDCPQVILVDYVINGQEKGYDIMEAAREMNSDCFVIVMSGFGDPDIYEKFINGGIDKWVNKNKKGWVEKLVQYVNEGISIVTAKKKLLEIVHNRDANMEEIKRKLNHER